MNTFALSLAGSSNMDGVKWSPAKAPAQEGRGPLSPRFREAWVKMGYSLVEGMQDFAPYPMVWQDSDSDEGILSDTDLNRLVSLASLPAGWDSYDADSISRDALAGAKSVIARVVIQTGAHPYAIRPLVDGGVQIVWRGSDTEVEVDVSPDETLGYLLVRNPDGDSQYTEKDDAPTEEILRVVSDVVG